MRGRLIELIQKSVQGCARHWAEIIADHLLANGVIVPPHKVGAKVFVLGSRTSDGKNLYIFEDTISHYVVGDNGTMMCFENHIAESSHNWDMVFPHREDAENKLKEIQSNE